MSSKKKITDSQNTNKSTKNLKIKKSTKKDKIPEKVIKSKMQAINIQFQKKNQRKNISLSIINLFYEEPNIFFKNHKTYLAKTSFFDCCDISIFSHYFYVLFQDYRAKKKQNYDKKSETFFEIYNNNFNSFFTEYKNNLIIQDCYLDTAFHKLAKLRDKNFFFEICKRLLDIKIFNNEILSIKNFAEETCFNYIVDDINNNYLSIIKKSDYLNYKNFLNSFPDLIEKITTTNKKAMIMNFNLGLYFDMVKFNEYDFTNLYDKIINLINNNIYSFLIDYFNCGINYLNCLFGLCNSSNDYNKLLNLINEHLAKNDSFNILIYNHIGYVLRKMNSYKRKGEKEINYGNNLIVTFLENNLKNKTHEEIYTILFQRKINIKEREMNIFKEGIIYNLLYNQNINFDKKTEIFDILKKITNLELEKEIKLDFIDLYKFFKLIQKNEITKNNLADIYKENEFIKNIFAEFIIYIHLCKYIKILCEKTDIQNYKEFINEVNNYMNVSKLEFIKNYKLRHGLSNEQIKKILDLILLCIENDIIDENDFKDNKIVIYIENNKFKEEIKRDFILSNEKLVLASLKYIMQKDNNISYSYLFGILFNCKYDLTDFINENKNDIIFKIKLANSVEPIKIIKKDLNLKNISHLCPFIDDYQNYSMSYSFKDIFKNAKSNNTPISYYYFFLLLSDYYHDLNILSDKKINFVFKLKSLIKKNLLFFLNDWDKPYDYTEMLNEIESNILQFCRILINKDIDTPEENTLKINFFFDFLSELKPESKNTFEEYKNLANLYHSSTSKKYGYQAIEKKTLNKFYLLLILIYTKVKYGDYNPEILFLFMHFYNDYGNILLIFINCIKENNNNNEIKNHFFMGKFNKNNNNIKYIKDLILIDIMFGHNQEKSIYFFLDNLIFFFRKYLSDLYEIKYSLVFNYLNEILTTNGKYEKEKHYLYPSIILNIGQNEKINKIILEKIYSSEISFFEFLKEEYDIKNENKFRKIIHLFDKMTKNETIKSGFICPDITSNKYLFGTFIEQKNIVLNLYLLFQGLKKKNIPLYDCVNSNFIFLKDIVYLLYYIQDIFGEKFLFVAYNIFGKNSIEKIDFLSEEIYDFLLSFCLLCKNSSNYSTIKESIEILLHIEPFVKVFYKKINSLNNKNSINIEYDKFIDFIKFYFPKIIDSSDKLEYYLKNILVVFMEKNPEKFVDITKFIIENFNIGKNKIIYIIYDIILNIIEKDLEKYKTYLSEFLSLIKEYLNLDNDKALHKKNFILNYLLRNTEYKDETNIFNKKNLDPNNNDKIKIICFKLFNYIDNKDMSSYLFFQIRDTNIFVNEENFLFLILLNGVENEYVIDYLLNFINEERQKIFFEENKIIIIKSLFLYGQTNGYIYIQKIFKFIKKFLSINDFKNIIYPLKDIEEEIFKSVNYLEEPIDEFFKSKDKYLFHYCLTKRRVVNYETIAILFENCPKTNAILDLCPFLSGNLESILKDSKIINYLEYFRKEKNRILIRKLSTSFYNFSLFIETLFDKINNFKENNNNIEKLLFLYFVKINILETTPDELLIFFDFEINEEPYDNENYDSWFIDELLNRRKRRIITEKNIFIIFAFYELKGLPIISIKNYMPEFYSKIENYYQKFKKIDIPNCCIKKPFDINLYDKLKFIIRNKTNKLLNYFYEHYFLLNLIFIIEKENNLLFNLSINNRNYLEKIIYNLVANNDIESQISENNYEKYMKAIRSSFGCNEFEEDEDISPNATRFTEEKDDDLFDDNNIMSNTLIKDCIFTLKNFNVNVSILIEKCFLNYFFSDKYNYLSVLKLYLRIILNICNHIIFNDFYSKENNNEFNLLSDNINIFNIFNSYNEKFKMMKNTIDIRQINYLILKNYEDQEMLNGFELFEVIQNWMINYIESKEIIKIFNDLEKEKFTYLTYFKYLRYTCMIIINFLKRIEDIDYKRINYINKDNRYRINNFNFILEKDKNKAKELFGISLFNLGNEIWEKIDNKKDKLIYESPLNICYYFNEEKKEYLETYTDICLNDFVRDKIYFIFLFLEHIYADTLIKDKKNKDKNSEQNLLVYEIKKLNERKIGEITEYMMPEKCKNEKINNILELLCCNHFKDFISYHLEATAYNDILILQNSPQKYFDNLYFSYVRSYFYFNKNLLKYCNDLSHFEKDKIYETVIDFYELIKAIKETEFHKNEKLNDYFQIKAINYLINNDNSLIYIFIHEVYKLIHDEMIYRGEKELLIKERFKIKVNTGYNYSSSYINKTIDKYNKKNIKEKEKIENIEKTESKEIKENNNNLNKNKQKEKNKEKTLTINEINNLGGKKTKFKLKLRCNTEENKQNNNIIKKESNNNLNKEKEDNNIDNIVIKNNYKRKNIPIINYGGHIPQSNRTFGISKGVHLTNIFGNEIIIEKKIGNNKINLLGNEKEDKKTQKKLILKNNDNSINIFNLIFKIGNLNKKEIIINQYDISKILEPYLEEDKFINLINNSLNYKTKVDDIPKYWPKFLNLSFIYSKLGYDYIENYSFKGNSNI